MYVNETNNAIEVQGVSKFFSAFSLQDATLQLPKGSILGLVGENGAGKTTLIKLIMNVIERNAGKIYVLGQDNQQPDFTQLKQEIGVVLDEAYFPAVLTAKHVNQIMRRTYNKWDETYFIELMERFALPQNKKFSTYSRGMKMKLAIAVAIAHHPSLLILDEPTSGLDPMVREEILDIFNDFTRDEANSILFSSHIVSDLEKICDYVAFLHQGKLQFCKEKDQLLEEYALVKLSQEDFEALPEEAVLSKKISSYGVEALVLKHQIADVFVTEHTSLEDIILFMAKGERK
ncbi:MAG: ABC transporter ATP-binding protein [Peptococcaceae bacterium]|jgi:ABC-2 type transport system ATP-binding protein|nr:ABC transporter ATP-binding protein [Peptococcaceae bacterium]